MYCRVLRSISTDVAEMRAASIVRAMSVTIFFMTCIPALALSTRPLWRKNGSESLEKICALALRCRVLKFGCAKTCYNVASRCVEYLNLVYFLRVSFTHQSLNARAPYNYTFRSCKINTHSEPDDILIWPKRVVIRDKYIIRMMRMWQGENTQALSK
jgi:hypothetical protein